MRATRLAILAALAGALASCNVDYGFGCRRLAGPYCLEQWEDGGTYYLLDRSSGTTGGGGVIDGTVQRIAWTRELILAERKANFGGDPNGWMVINASGKTVRGPIPESEAQAILIRERLRPMSAADAWQRLAW
jgi:hypothetical protein